MLLRKEVRDCLVKVTSDESLIRRFAQVWPLAEQILEAFARAIHLPIFVFLNDHFVFRSSQETLPPFCSVMLDSEETAQLCLIDGKKRALLEEGEIAPGLQLCHAGLLNGRRTVEIPPLGLLHILYGSRESVTSTARSRRRSILNSLKDTELLTTLRSASSGLAEPNGIHAKDQTLMDAIANTLENLFKVTLDFHWVSVNMAHELSAMWLGAGLALRDLEEELHDVMIKSSEAYESMVDLYQQIDPVLAESQLGLYVCRNFLSHVSETRYKDAVKTRFSLVDFERIVREIVELHRRTAGGKSIDIEIVEPLDLPKVFGEGNELRRALHNILSNGIKYSYHSTSKSRRVIKIWSKTPYDPGFQKKRFSVIVQNYGIGATPEELPKIGKAGFRGSQAVAEVPIGSGIGLAEVRKILNLHSGSLKFRSHEVHRDSKDVPTYLTELEVILPYAKKASEL